MLHANTRLFLAILFALVCACEPAQAKTLRVSLSDDATTLDPHVANLAINNRLLANIYESLVRRDAEFNIAPSLALSWSQPDAKTWRFKLRPGVKFHDGSAFTADDVVFSVARALNPLSNLKSTVQGVASAKKVDDMTVDLIMAEPNPVLLKHLAGFSVMSKSWAAKHGVTLPQNYNNKEETHAVRNANGTGPFKVASRLLDVKTTLVEHAEWWNRNAPDRGNVKTVEWMPIKSNSTRIAALMTGSIDFVMDPAVQDRERIKNMPATKLTVASEPRTIFLAFDHFRDELQYSSVKGKNPLRDLRVRQAIAHSIDANLLIDKVMRGYGRPTALIAGEEMTGYSADIDRRLPHDPARGKKLMAEAGYAAGFELTMECPNQTPFVELCQALGPMLASIGVQLKLNVMPFATIFQKIDKNDTSSLIMGYGSATADAQALLQPLLGSKSTDGSGRGDSNWGRYSNSKLDALIGQIGREGEVGKRNAAIREALLIQRDDLAVIPLYQVKVAWAMRKNVDAPYKVVNMPQFYRFRVNP
ncbi:MAG: ABC transporter substrate-binding protein [Betaproteobacteria bacterium]|nr:ABC transporter substrate-binding protein [Betaproteobacteria bacterium]